MQKCGEPLRKNLKMKVIKMSEKDYKFDDTFTFKSVEFVVEVYEETYSFGWAHPNKPSVDRRVGELKPNEKVGTDDWPKGANKRFRNVDWYERPVKRPLLKKLLYGKYKVEEQSVERTVKEQVEELMDALFEEWNEHANTDGFEDIGMQKIDV